MAGQGKTPVFTPGGGGGAGIPGQPGGAGAAGQVELVFTPGGAPAYNIVRFLLHVPVAGDANNAIVAQYKTNGKVATVILTYTTAASGSLVMTGKDSGGSLLFTSAAQTAINGALFMISMELTPGATIGYNLGVLQLTPLIIFGSSSGTASASGAIGSVSEVDVNPAGGLVSSTVGNVLVQYSFEDLDVLTGGTLSGHGFGPANGYSGELAATRFSRLCTEEGIPFEVKAKASETSWGFEGGTQGWTAKLNCSVSLSTQSDPLAPWPPEGTHSLQVSPSSNAAFYAESPAGLGGIPVSPGNVVMVKARATGSSSAAAILNAYVAIEWFNSSGTSVSVVTGTTAQVADSASTPLSVTGTAPGTAAFLAIRGGGSGYSSLTTLLLDAVACVIDSTPAMGPQPDAKLMDVLQQTEDLDRGLLYETPAYLGLGYRCYSDLLNQNPAIDGVVADYAQGHLSQPFQPVDDDQLTRNDVTITRVNGSSFTVTATTGPLSTLAAVAAPILALGTVDDFRFPQVTFDLRRSEVKELYAALTGMTIGDRLRILNPPSFLTAATIEQLVYGFTLAISGFEFTMEMNCVPESPFEQ
jgi:hypothetical protein